MGRTGVFVAAVSLVVSLGAAVGARPAAAADFVDGRGGASGQVAAIVPRAGNAALPISLGLSTAAFRSRTGIAESDTLDLGLVGTLLTLGICGGDPILTPDQVPSPLHADSSDGPSKKSRTTAGDGSTGPAAGVEAAEARPGSFASSTTTPGAFEIPGLLRVAGTSHAESELQPGRQRIAHGVSDLDITLLGGLVELHGARWDATQVTGPDGKPTKQVGTFSIGAAIVGGVALPAATTSQLAAVVDAVNAVTKPYIVSFTLPHPVIGSDGAVSVPPIGLDISGGPQSAMYLQPLLATDGATQARRQLENALLFGGCAPGVKGTPLQQLGGGVNTVLDVLLAGAVGNGGVGLEIGGVRASTDASTVGNAFDAFATVPTLGEVLFGAPPPTAVLGDAAVAAPPPVVALAPPGATRTSVRCVSASGHGPACSTGHPAIAVVLGAAVLGALVAADGLRRRRTRLEAPS